MADTKINLPLLHKSTDIIISPISNLNASTQTVQYQSQSGVRSPPALVDNFKNGTLNSLG
jgi:hypothetical protein